MPGGLVPKRKPGTAASRFVSGRGARIVVVTLRRVCMILSPSVGLVMCMRLGLSESSQYQVPLTFRRAVEWAYVPSSVSRMKPSSWYAAVACSLCRVASRAPMVRLAISAFEKMGFRSRPMVIISQKPKTSIEKFPSFSS
jgi:hypothetical protein